jgi:hypothetical protein
MRCLTSRAVAVLLAAALSFPGDVASAQAFAGCDVRGNCFTFSFTTGPAHPVLTTPSGDPLYPLYLPAGTANVVSTISPAPGVPGELFYGRLFPTFSVGTPFFIDADAADIGLRPGGGGRLDLGVTSLAEPFGPIGFLTAPGRVVSVSLEVNPVDLIGGSGSPPFTELVTLAAVPEPSVVGLLATGLFAVGMTVARRRR